jgi:hypothetical protein
MCKDSGLWGIRKGKWKNIHGWCSRQNSRNCRMHHQRVILLSKNCWVAYSTLQDEGTLIWQSTAQQHSQRYLSHIHCTIKATQRHITASLNAYNWEQITYCNSSNKCPGTNERQKTIHFSSSRTHKKTITELQYQTTFESANSDPKALPMSVWDMKTL